MSGFQPAQAHEAAAVRERLEAYRAATAEHALRFELAPVPRSREIFMDARRMDELRQLGYL